MKGGTPWLGTVAATNRISTASAAPSIAGLSFASLIWSASTGRSGSSWRPITAPRGWELVRHAGPLPSHPDEDDLIALADAVREGRDGVPVINGVTAGFSDPATGVHGGALMAPAARRPESNGRRRGHLRVLPDPCD